MPTLYITEPGATVRLRSESLEVTIPEEAMENAVEAKPADLPPRQVELHRLELVALVGRAHITSEAMLACLDRGVAVAFFRRDGRFRGRLCPGSDRCGDLRVLQYAAHNDASARLVRARHVVWAKARNAMAVLAGHQSNDSRNPALPAAIAALKAMVTGIEAAMSPESLLGHEGTAARHYFGALATTFRGEIGFTARRQHPSPDPANALLSFGYVLLGNLLAGRLEARGLDPAIGFFHEVHSGRPSLALDLLEELRHPVVDRFVVRACNLGMLRAEHFEPDPDRSGGVRATRAGLKIVLAEWEKHLLKLLRDAEGGEKIAVRHLMDRQIERLVADLRGKAPYRPFLYGD